jgi:hypothetical protein
MSDSANNREFVELVLAVYAGEAEEEQIDRLESLLKTEPWARARFADLMLLQSQLGWSAIYDCEHYGRRHPPSAGKHESDCKLDLDVKRISRSRTRVRDTAHRITKWAAAGFSNVAAVARSPLAIAAIILLATGLWWSQREMQDLRDKLAQRDAANLPVAYLAYSNGCDWGAGPFGVRNVGSAIQSGDDISLYEGIAEFRLASGVLVSVEAPASLVINSASSLVLLYGKVTLLAPWEATDLRVTAGPCQFAARDAEFGVIHQGNKIGVHVFSGEVRAASPSMSYDPDVDDSSGGSVVTDDTGIFGRAMITAGAAISLVDDDGIVKVNEMGLDAKPELFATKLSMSGVLPASGSYSDAVRRSNPVGYWRFEQIQDQIVQNEIPGGANLKVVGNVRFTGEALDKAAEFRPGAESYLVSDRALTGGEAANYCMEAWIKPSYVHIGGFALLVSDEPELHASTLEIQGSRKSPGSTRRGLLHPATVRFVHHNAAAESTTDYGFTDCFSKERYLVRRWQHVVAVKEGPSMRLYLNGRQVASARDKSPLSPNSRLAIGQDAFHHGTRWFVGQIDEVAFYDRALSAEEIAAHYQAPNWNAQPAAKRIGGI